MRMTLAMALTALCLVALSGSVISLAAMAPSEPGEDSNRSSLSAPLRAVVAATADYEYQRVEPTSEAASLSLEDLRAGQEAWRANLTSLGGKFVYELQRRFETGIERNFKEKGILVPADFSFSLRFAIKDDKRFEEYEERSAGNGGAKASFQGKPIAFVDAFNGVQAKRHEPYRALGTIEQGKPKGFAAHSNWYLQAISLGLGHEGELLKETELFIPTALGRAWQYRVLPRLEKVDGFPCHVVASKHDAFWVDPKHGFAVRRRVWLNVGATPEDVRELNFISICKEFVDCGSGIWLPTDYYCLHYPENEVPPDQRMRIASIDKIHVSSIHVNDLPDSDFEIDFPPGTHVMDLVRNLSYVVPKGEELLDRALAEADPIVHGAVMPGGKAPHSYGRWLWIGNGILAAVLLALIVARRLRARKAGII